MNGRWLRVCLVGVALGGSGVFRASTTVAAPTNAWQAIAGGGKWEYGPNWSQGVPSLAHGVHFIGAGNVPADATIDVATVLSNIINGCLTVSNVSLRGGTGALGQPATLLLNNANDTPGNAALLVVSNVNLHARGNLTLTNSRMRVFREMFNDGTVRLFDGAELLITNILMFTHVGHSAVGQMTIGGGTFQARELTVGNLTGARGTLTVAGGSTSVGNGLRLGAAAGATGTVWMTGGQLSVLSPSVGDTGFGQMTISNGTFSASSNGNVGHLGNGMLTVAGGLHSARGLFVGNVAGATGEVWLTGGELTATNSGVQFIGRGGTGRVTLSNGMWRVVRTHVAELPGAAGTLTIAGGTNLIVGLTTFPPVPPLIVGNSDCSATGNVTVTGGLLVATNDLIDVRSGTFTISGGTFLALGIIVTNPCGRFIHTGGTLVHAGLLLTPEFDADGDGMSNGFEEASGLNPLDPADAALDNDGDGFPNLQEALASTDPNDSASAFRITNVAREGDNLRVTWQTVGGKTNIVHFTTGDASGGHTNNFTDLATTIITGSGVTLTNYLHVGGTLATNGDYRIRLVP